MSPKPVRLTIDTAWELWRDQQDGEAKDWLIIHYSSLVKFVAGRLAAGLPRSVETNDLVSAGVFGLMDAVNRFSPEFGVKFETFAVPRIRGAILDSLRALDWVPRTVRANSRAIEDAISKLEHKLHRSPTEEEIAEQLEISVEDLQKQLSEAAAGNVGPLDHVVLTSDDGAPHKSVEEKELREAMRDGIRNLPERERTVMVLYYSEGLTLSEIGEVLGVTEARTSQIHAKAVMQLRARLRSVGLS